ncbi:MAG: transposase [Rickettsiaceae bacterium]
MEYRKGSNSIYDLKYHIIFCTKYRYRVLIGQIADRTREICAANCIDIVSRSMRPDYVHLLISVPLSISYKGSVIC